MQCLLDLDGVLVDFVGGACRFHGRKNPYVFDPVNTRGQWDVVGLLGMDPTEFWQGLDRYFWRSLDWMEDGREILEVVENKFGKENVCLLSLPCDTVGCCDGKREWVREHLPDYSRRLLLGSAKEFAASPERVLIDDYPSNVERFGEAGGQSLLVPRPWNVLYVYNPINWVRNSLENMSNDCQIEHRTR